MSKSNEKRWRATINYVDVSQDVIPFDEFNELGEHIEHGVDWNLITSITIRLVKSTPIGKTK